MRHRPRWPVILLGLLLATVLAGAAFTGRQERGAVYSVREVQVGLAHDPAAWLGRTILLRGVADATGCFVETPDTVLLCGAPRVLLSDADPATAGMSLPLAWAGPDPWLAIVRRVPLVGGLLPAPQAVGWGAVTTYRVELRALPDPVCGAGTCYEALLLDAAP